MAIISIDIETFSSVSLPDAGVYKYAEAPDFEIMLMQYKWNQDAVQVIDLQRKEPLPAQLEEAFNAPEKHTWRAWNANFERVGLGKIWPEMLNPEIWQCTMIKAANLTLPFALEQCAKVLKLAEQKDMAGKALIRYFCMPCKPTEANGMRTRNLPEHDIAKWEKFKTYGKQDVITEDAIAEKISFFTIPAQEKQLWNLDQRINDRGIFIDQDFIKNAMAIDTAHRENVTEEAIAITELNNPNSAPQLKKWLTLKMPFSEIDKLKKEDIPVLKTESEVYENSDILKRVLSIRQEMSKTSIKKYNAMLESVCADGKVRGLLQFYGASRTGRWAGRLIQVHNLPKNYLEDLHLARQCVKENNRALLGLLFGNIPDTLSQLIRTAFVPQTGKRFVVSDFRQIEARVLAWLAGEKWRLKIFIDGGDIYIMSASMMFKVPIAEVTSELRDRGKVSELALGYQGGVNALEKMDIKKVLKPSERAPIVKAWREANPKIVAYWKTIGNAAILAVTKPGNIIPLDKNMSMQVRRDILFIKLPSGRELAYLSPRLEDGQYGPVLTYQGMNQTTQVWGKQYTYGGKLTENIVQAIARDCLAEKLLLADENNYPIAMHVHDEIVCDITEGHGSLQDINKLLSAPIAWAPGLPLSAAGFEGYYYKK